MQEWIVNGLLMAIAVLAAILLLIGQKGDDMTGKQRRMLWRILASALLLLLLQLAGPEPFDRMGNAGRWVRLAAYFADYLLIGYDILKKAFRGSATVASLMKTFSWQWRLSALWRWRSTKTETIWKPLR